ncbi:toxin Doc [Streptomyces sp. H27-D2]|uniref:toxin Doc n=1 Tax=Streptomyces sp. H27-D2 TaxID=3046304 RepID=UPI002DB98D14|nr:toxin Doc [Streptomyces sp. H27-D2]MEC4020780.1 toxin Doc [Streptomyces sp. H27-D2]
MPLQIDLPWLLGIQEQKLDEEPVVHDYTALAAAVARHAFDAAKFEHEPDTAWRAAALMETLVRLQPLPGRNSLYACMVVVAYMAAAGEGVDAPYGAMVDLARDIKDYQADVYESADRIRGWRI